MLISLPNAIGDAAMNMAVDASLLQTLPKGTAVFRHYAWTEPAITFGYTQKFQEVAKLTSDELIHCRRLTGGGIVDHRNDWTYALIIESSLHPARTPANDLYEQIHHAIQTALKAQSIESKLAPCPRKCGEKAAQVIALEASQCFITPAANDVLRPDGRKIAGAAMKRSREGLLLQGSLDRAALPEQFNALSFQKEFLTNLSETLSLPINAREDIRHLFDGVHIQKERERFASKDWNQKR